MRKKTIKGLIDYARELIEKGDSDTVFVIVSDKNGRGSVVSGNPIDIAADLAYCMNEIEGLKKVCEMAIDAYTNVLYQKADR